MMGGLDSDLELADGAEEVRLGAAPHAGEVLLQAAEALRGMDEPSSAEDGFNIFMRCRANPGGRWSVSWWADEGKERLQKWRKQAKKINRDVSCLAFSRGQQPVSTEGYPM